jgi:hypothetical protein
MKQEIIRNVYDGPVKIKVKTETEQFSFEFSFSEELDIGIRESMRNVKDSILAMGIALYRIEAAGLYIDLGFRRFGEYIDKLAEDAGMSRANLYN